MAYKRKYKKGRIIISIVGLVTILKNEEFVYIRDKIYHRGWVLSLQLRYISNMIDSDNVYRAVKINGIHK